MDKFKEEFINKAIDYFNSLDINYVKEEHALRADLIGLKIFDEPIFAIGDAKDPLFQKLKDDKVVSKEYITQMSG